jgi:hypothetical protein
MFRRVIRAALRCVLAYALLFCSDHVLAVIALVASLVFSPPPGSVP